MLESAAQQKRDIAGPWNMFLVSRFKSKADKGMSEPTHKSNKKVKYETRVKTYNLINKKITKYRQSHFTVTLPKQKSPDKTNHLKHFCSTQIQK